MKQVYKPDAREQWNATWRPWLRYAICALPVLLCIVAIYYIGYAPKVIEQADTSDSPLLEGTAKITGVTQQPGRTTDLDQSPLYIVHFERNDYVVRSGIGVRKGDPIHITYRVGKSGKVYIKRIEPMPVSGDR